MAEIINGWELSEIYDQELPRFNELRAMPGTFRKSSKLLKSNKGKNRPYGGTHLSIARLKATTPTRHYIPAINRGDITM